MNNGPTKSTSEVAGKASKSPKKTNQLDPKRKDRQQIIYEVISANGGKLLPSEVEDLAQKAKPASKGSYAHTAQRAFVVGKDGKVLPELTGDTMAGQFRYCKSLSTPTCSVQHFPEQAAKVAAKFKLPLPKVEKGSK